MRGPVEDWTPRPAWKRNHLRTALKRLEKRLANSQAYIRKPRQRDLERWRKIQAQIDSVAAQLKEFDNAQP